MSGDLKREALLAALRCTRLRLQLLVLEIDELGLLVAHGAASPEAAAGRLHELGLLPLVNPDVVSVEAA